MAAHQAPPFLGFSRQEHRSGLPFPSPMHESEKWKWSCVRLLATPWTVAYEAPPSMGFPRQAYWSGVPLPSPTKGPAFRTNNTCPTNTCSVDACPMDAEPRLFKAATWSKRADPRSEKELSHSRNTLSLLNDTLLLKITTDPWGKGKLK